MLYEGLVRVAPTLGAFVGRAAAIAEASGPAERSPHWTPSTRIGPQLSAVLGSARAPVVAARSRGGRDDRVRQSHRIDS